MKISLSIDGISIFNTKTQKPAMINASKIKRKIDLHKFLRHSGWILGTEALNTNAIDTTILTMKRRKKYRPYQIDKQYMFLLMNADHNDSVFRGQRTVRHLSLILFSEKYK